MKKLIVAFVAALALSSPVAAQHSHGSKGPNGGILEDVAGVHAELVTSGNTITINILDEGNKPLSTQGYTGSVLVVAGSDRETVKLEPGGTSLKGEARRALAANTQFTLMLKTAAGKSGQARYKK
ncbi:MAG: hypothetical protein K2Y27_24080 [Xanthobacteraceae bacterium]|nr:hypothetical protein [Xanthobacteraceae bacterium]